MKYLGLIYLILSVAAISCDSDGPIPNEKPSEPDVSLSNKWDTIYCAIKPEKEIYIGRRFVGVQNWPHNSNPPSIYVDAVYPEESFGTNFDKEVTGEKNPVTLYTDFSDPYVETINAPSGKAYLQFIKGMLKSDEYAGDNTPAIDLYRIKQLKSLSKAEECFPDNKTLGETICKIAEQSFGNPTSTLALGEITYRGLSVSMDIPANGIFTDDPKNSDKLVYTRRLTYGATGYFIIGSDMKYQDLKSALSKPSFSSGITNGQIILITVDTPDQNGIIHRSFSDLNDFFMQPYSDGSYGYPIYCQGCYVSDNSIFDNH